MFAFASNNYIIVYKMHIGWNRTVEFRGWVIFLPGGILDGNSPLGVKSSSSSVGVHIVIVSVVIGCMVVFAVLVASAFDLSKAFSGQKKAT